MIRRFHLDRVLFIIVLVLFVFGSVVMYSASTSQHPDSTHYLKRHLINSMVAFGVALGFSIFPHQLLKQLRWIILGGIYLLLLAVLVISELRDYTHPARWLYLGGFSIQVADVVRLGLIIFLADFLHRHQEKLDDLKATVIPVFLLVASVSILVAIQSDLSSGLMIMFIGLVLFYLGNLQLSHISAFLSLGISCSLLYAKMNSYMWQRIMSFINDNVDTMDAGFQVHQSLAGLARGSWLGVGLGNSYVKDLFLPEPHTDFVFAILGEEFGFMGGAVFLLLFLGLFMRGLRIARNSTDFYSMLLAIGISFSLFSYALVNVAVVTGLVPTTGLPLPLISYGGSNLLITAAMLGILFNISSNNESGKHYGPSKVVNLEF